MVLLVTAVDRGERCAEAIRLLTGETVRLAADLPAGLAELRRNQFTAVVIDQLLFWEGDTRLGDRFPGACGTAALVVTNFAISGVERVAREVRAALRRREGELRRARQEAASRLRTELNEAVTGILLSSELALQTPALPNPVASKIRAVYELAMSIRERLRAGE